jgi:hypothetical protein
MRHFLFDKSKNMSYTPMSYTSNQTSLKVSASSFLWVNLIIWIIIGSTGLSLYISEKHNQSIYKPTVCFVQNYSLVESQCLTEKCSGGFLSSCTTIDYACDLHTYVIIYNVSDGRQIQLTKREKDGSGSKSVSVYEYYFKILFKLNI